MNGKARFVCLRPSGVVVAERALKTVRARITVLSPGAAAVCLNRTADDGCTSAAQAPSAVAELLGGQPLDSQQQVIIYGTEEEQEVRRFFTQTSLTDLSAKLVSCFMNARAHTYIYI